MGESAVDTYMNTYKYTDYLRISSKDNLVILASEESREWIKISKECFNILNNVLERDLCHDEILNCFEKEDDKLYFNSILNNLYKAKILKNKDDKVNRQMESVYLILTDRCNLSCTHCCANALDVGLDDELDTESIFKIVDKILQINPSNITISGGEPLVRPDIWLIMDYLKSKFTGPIDMMTNGLLIDENNINNIKKYFDSLSISVDGVDEESCRIIRGNNVFKAVMKKVQFLKNNNFDKISLSAVLPNNEGINLEFEKLNKNLGTESMIRHFSYQGRAQDNHKKIEEGMNKYLRDRNMKEKNINDWKPYIPEDKRNVRIGACGGCENTLCVGSNGELYPCNLLMTREYSIGNILEIEDLSSYINNMSNNNGFKAFTDLKLCNKDKCSECDIKSFCWSCPAEYNDLLSKDDIFEDRCIKYKETLSSIVWG